MPQIQTPDGQIIQFPYGDEGASPAGGPPPELKALMAQLWGGQGGVTPTGPPAPESPTAILEQILGLADAYRQQEQSQQNRLLVERLRTIAQQLLASEEKEADGLLQGKLAPSAIRRFAGGG